MNRRDFLRGAAAAPLAIGAAAAGRPDSFASGGVLKPGPVGFVGERAPEAILPLKRMPSGSLGVVFDGIDVAPDGSRWTRWRRA